MRASRSSAGRASADAKSPPRSRGGGGRQRPHHHVDAERCDAPGAAGRQVPQPTLHPVARAPRYRPPWTRRSPPATAGPSRASGVHHERRCVRTGRPGARWRGSPSGVTQPRLRRAARRRPAQPARRTRPCGGGPRGWRDRRGCASGGGSHGCGCDAGCSAGKCACSRECSQKFVMFGLDCAHAGRTELSRQRLPNDTRPADRRANRTSRAAASSRHAVVTWIFSRTVCATRAEASLALLSRAAAGDRRYLEFRSLSYTVCG